MRTLSDRFDPRNNSFDILRLSFAALVAIAHGMDLHSNSQLFWGSSGLSDFGLDGFFILSGFLVTRSYLSLNSFARYAWHRFLRIMPGFWVCLLVVAFVVAPLAAVLQGMSPTVPFTGEPSAFGFVFFNVGLLMVQYDIAGILASTPHSPSFDGSLWTLVFEAFCYAVVGALGITGILQRRRVVVAATVAVLAVLTVLQEAGVPVFINDRLLRLVFVFLLGAVAYLYAERIPMHPALAAGAAVVFLGSVAAFDNYRVLGAAPLAYLYLWLGSCLPLRWSMRTDLSYGLYVYHWPIYQLLVLTELASLPTGGFVVVGIAVTLIPAAMSWFLVEKPALSRKRSPVPDRIASALQRRLRSWVEARGGTLPAERAGVRR